MERLSPAGQEHAQAFITWYIASFLIKLCRQEAGQGGHVSSPQTGFIVEAAKSRWTIRGMIRHVYSNEYVLFALRGNSMQQIFHSRQTLCVHNFPFKALHHACRLPHDQELLTKSLFRNQYGDQQTGVEVCNRNQGSDVYGSTCAPA